MGKKILIIQVAALSNDFSLEGLNSHRMESVFPAVTCTVQASFRTASLPARHGMIANGLFFRTLYRPMFWEQSARLVQGERIWENFRAREKRVAMLFWQQSLGESVDILLSPAPIHRHHGGMIQGCYCQPPDLYERLCKHIGRPFQLRHYWGPLASWKVGEWIAAATAAILEDHDLAPDLCFTYLPSLDYTLQRKDPEKDPECKEVRKRVEHQLSVLLRKAIASDYDILLYGDYCISPVEEAVFPNRILLKEGLLTTRSVKGMLYPDFYGSKAFALVDHEIAHIYLKNGEHIHDVKRLFSNLHGVERVMDRDEQREAGVDHANSGELLLIAQEGKWFAYPWWAQKAQAPEYAGHVDIHNKPGYDPCELSFGWPPGSVSQDTNRIRGSHGKIGPGREVTWATTLDLPYKPVDLIQLAQAVKQCLIERG